MLIQGNSNIDIAYKTYLSNKKDSEQNPQESKVLSTKNDYVTKVKYHTHYSKLLKNEDGTHSADVDNLKSFYSNGYFQPIEKFIDEMDNLNDKEKYCLKRSVLISMEKSGTSRTSHMGKGLKIEQNRTEMLMIAQTVVPENTDMNLKHVPMPI